MIIDYKQDLVNIFQTELSARGFTLASNTDIDTIAVQYFNLRNRLIPQVKRNIRISNVFTCPPDLSDALEKLKTKIVNGHDLTPHLSTRLTDLNYDDPMLNDWAIYHLHLGETMRPDRFIERTGKLLYATFDTDNFYFINVYDHDNWTKQAMIRILHDNWPQAIQHHLMTGVVGLTHSLTDEELKLARKHGVVSAIEIAPGIVYAPIGGGYTTARTSIRARRSANRIKKMIKDLESQTENKLDNVRQAAQERGITLADFHFKLEVQNGILQAIEQTSRIAITVGEWDRLPAA
jgi:hypothetical protein